MKALEKKSLRKYWKAFPPPTNANELCQKLLDHLLACPEIQIAKHIGLYSPFLWEPNLLKLWEKFPTKVAFPKIEDPTQGVFFHLIPSLDALKPGYSKIPEPPANTPRVVWEKEDLILVPGVSFDTDGIRLGSGKGYYDRFLANRSVDLKYWGVTYRARISATKLPREAHDIPMQRLVTDSGIFSISA